MPRFILAKRALPSSPPPAALVTPELELELIQPHMAQKTMLRAEVGARALRVRSVSREEAWACAGVQGAWVGGCGCEADQGVLWRQRLSLLRYSPAGVVQGSMTPVRLGNSS